MSYRAGTGRGEYAEIESSDVVGTSDGVSRSFSGTRLGCDAVLRCDAMRCVRVACWGHGFAG